MAYISYTRYLTEDEKTELRESISSEVGTTYALEDELKAVSEPLKLQIKDLKTSIKTNSILLRKGKMEVEQKGTMIPDYETMEMEYYDENGNYVHCRPLTAIEKKEQQLFHKITMSKNG